MKTCKVTGGDGVELHAVETGNPKGRPILFLHGFSQCSLSWSEQLESDLAESYRLVALDLRGHGESAKPREGYTDSRLWADDVHATISSLRLEQPILCGWSYGPLLILDYIRHYGEQNVGAIHFVDGLSKLGSEQAMAVLAPAFLNLVPGFFATEVEQSMASLQGLLGMCFAKPVSASDRYLALGYNTAVPPYVRQGLLSRSLDNDDLLARLRKPVLLTHGEEDAIVKPIVVQQHKALVAHAQVHLMAGAGHTPFRDDAMAFNQRLAAFAESLE